MTKVLDSSENKKPSFQENRKTCNFLQLKCNCSVQSLNRLIFLYLGSIGFLFLVFIWLAFALDFVGLDNAFVKLSNAKFVGYSIPELFGSSYKDPVSAQILCLKIFCSTFIKRLKQKTELCIVLSQQEKKDSILSSKFFLYVADVVLVFINFIYVFLL